MSSISFEPWTVGEERGAWTAVGREEDGLDQPSGTPLAWDEGSVGMMQEGAFIIGTAHCEAPRWSFSPEAVVLTCGDGRIAEWAGNLEHRSGPEGLADLRGYVPVLRSWDGHLLVGIG